MVPPPLYESGPVRLKRCRFGAMLYLVTDRYVGQSLDRYGEFSQPEMELLCGFIAAGDVVLDVGASVGTHTLFFAQAVTPSGRVLAFEPQRVLHQMLCGNAALGVHHHVQTRQAAVGARRGQVLVPQFDFAVVDNFSGLSVGDHESGEPVDRVAVDELELGECRLIKIDAEGSESQVLAGADETIRRCRPVLYVENDREARSGQLIEQLWGLGYRLFWHLPPLFNPDNYFANPDNVFGEIVSANLLALHESFAGPEPGLPRVTSSDETWRSVGGC